MSTTQTKPTDHHDVRDDPNEPARRDDHHGEGATRGTNRMEAFADGVFAIAFTLPVVEIVLPDPEGATRHLGADLLELWPSYVGYLLASAIIGLYWVHHHFSGAIYRTTGHWFLIATVVFLGAIGFIAFPARVIAEHFADPAAREPAVEYFVVSMTVLAWTWLFKWTVGWKRDQVDSRLETDYVHHLNRRYWAFALLNTLAAAIVFFHWPSGLALCAALTATLLIPPRTPRYRTQSPIVEGES